MIPSALLGLCVLAWWPLPGASPAGPPQAPEVGAEDGDRLVVESGSPVGDPADDDPDLVVEPARARARPVIATMSGATAVVAAVDLRRVKGADLVELRSRLTLRLTLEPHPSLTAVVAARLDHGAWWPARATSPPSSARAAFEPALDAGFVRWRAHVGLDLTVGVQRLRWGATTLERPFDALAPHDLRYGPLPTLDTPSLPVFAVDLRQTLGPLAVELLWVPFFTPHAVLLFGGDWALLEGPLAAAAPASLRRAVLALPPGPRHRDQWSLAITDEPPMDGLTGADVGLRLTTRLGGLDLAVAWAWHWDRAPLLTADPSGPDGLAIRFGRSHLIGLELAWTWELFAFAVDALWTDQRTYYTPALESVRRPALHVAVEVGARPAPWLDASLAVGHLRVFDAPDEPLIGAGDATTRVSARLGAMLAWDGALRLDVRGSWGVSLREGAVDLGLTWRATRALEFAVGAVLIGGSDAHPSLGWLYADNDSAYLRTSYAF